MKGVFWGIYDFLQSEYMYSLWDGPCEYMYSLWDGELKRWASTCTRPGGLIKLRVHVLALGLPG